MTARQTQSRYIAPQHGYVEAPARPARPSAAPTVSPATQMQAELARAFDASPSPDKWSARRTAAFLVLSCGLFWTGLAYVVVPAL